MFEMLNKNIPSDKALLSFEPFVIDQKPGVKQASYRPEVAWHLDRDIEVARTLTEIEEKKQTGNYPVYLMPLNHQDTKLEDYLLRLNDELRKRYMGVHINAVDGGEVTKEGKFLRVGMPTYMIFDLRSEDDGN
jgi:phage-related protein